MAHDCTYCGTTLTSPRCVSCGAGQSYAPPEHRPPVRDSIVTKYGGCGGSDNLNDLLSLPSRKLSILVNETRILTGDTGS